MIINKFLSIKRTVSGQILFELEKRWQWSQKSRFLVIGQNDSTPKESELLSLAHEGGVPAAPLLYG